jgi:UDP-N-acetylmuramoyl-L-alanyl-D-glutamate--2,6-diaminopimelate ligase
MERITVDEVPGLPLAVVDYAHSPDAVGLAVAAVRDRAAPLVVVLGAGGDRDAGKRPLMGAAAAGADVVVVTDDNPRSEDPASIRAAVLRGVAEGAARRRGQGGPAVTVLEIPDRAEAIAEGVRRAWSPTGSGVLLVLGKGHEQGQQVAGAVHPFDDRDEVRGALRRAGADGPGVGELLR